MRSQGPTGKSEKDPSCAKVHSRVTYRKFRESLPSSIRFWAVGADPDVCFAVFGIISVQTTAGGRLEEQSPRDLCLVKQSWIQNRIQLAPVTPNMPTKEGSSQS